MVIKYRYALDSVNRVVDITLLNREKATNKELYKCLGCDNILIPVLGQKRQKHFRHKIDLDCSSETYLHKLAKQKFFEVYNNCLLEKIPFVIRLNQELECNYFQKSFSFNCQLGDKLVTYDLTKYFCKIYLEEKENSFIPDLLLVSTTGEKIFIEIAVTHFSSERKLNSGYRLIEIVITNEDDIEVINSKKLTQTEQVRFFNFNTNLSKNSCGGKCYLNFEPFSYCELKYDYFVVFKTGKSAILSVGISEMETWYKNNKINYGEFIFLNNYRFAIKKVYLKLVIESFINDRGIKNCFLCRYHGKSYYSEQPIFCKFLKKNCGSNEAAICEYYCPDTKVFPTLDFEDF